jgi:hypothetical protein
LTKCCWFFFSQLLFIEDIFCFSFFLSICKSNIFHWRATVNSFRLTTVTNTMLIYVHSFRLGQPLLSGWVPKIVFQLNRFCLCKKFTDESYQCNSCWGVALYFFLLMLYKTSTCKIFWLRCCFFSQLLFVIARLKHKMFQWYFFAAQLMFVFILHLFYSSSHIVLSG